MFQFKKKWHRYHVNSIDFDASGSRLASCSTDGSVSIWQAATGEEICSEQPPFQSQAALRVCKWSPCGGYVATAGDDENVAIFRFDSNRLKYVR